MKTYKYIIPMIIFFTFSCDDQWLEVRRDKKQVIPHTLEDFQALLDYSAAINTWSVTSLGEAGSDDFYVSDTDWEGINRVSPLQQKNAYIWAEEIFDQENSGSSWDRPYTIIYYCNVVLDGLKTTNITKDRQDDANRIKGSALFIRALAFYHLAQVFCPPFNASTAKQDLGIALRMESDPNVPSTRSSVEETYNRILEDLTEATALLPDMGLYLNRPGKAAAYALLARVYRIRNDYQNALIAAQKSLAIHHELMDYNTLNPDLNYPIDNFNSEMIFYATMVTMTGGLLLEDKLIVTPELYNLYEQNDLRKSIFYIKDEDNLIRYRGSYANGDFFGMHKFAGLATDEVILIQAECLAQLNQKDKAIEALNTLLQKRYRTGTYTSPAPDDDILQLIVNERRKELVFRGLRWTDLRQNRGSAQGTTTLTRTVSGQTYTLEPGSPKYTLPIPPFIIQLTKMQQNQR